MTIDDHLIVSSGMDCKSDVTIKTDTASVDATIIQLSETLVTTFNKPQKLLDGPGSLTNIGQAVLTGSNPLSTSCRYCNMHRGSLVI